MKWRVHEDRIGQGGAYRWHIQSHGSSNDGRQEAHGAGMLFPVPNETHWRLAKDVAREDEEDGHGGIPTAEEDAQERQVDQIVVAVLAETVLVDVAIEVSDIVLDEHQESGESAQAIEKGCVTGRRTWNHMVWFRVRLPISERGGGEGIIQSEARIPIMVHIHSSRHLRT